MYPNKPLSGSSTLSFPHDGKTIFTEPEAARYIGVSLSKIRRLRRSGHGTSYVRIGRAIQYRKPALDRYLDDHTVQQIA